LTTILLVKTSSLGDVVHNLPVVADIRTALGDVAVDWVVERSFAAIPALHPGVRRVIPCELRRWRRSWRSAETRDEWRAFGRALREAAYDAIIDTQGLLKSAVLARLAQGRRYGLDWRSSREPLRPFYDRVFSVPRDLHAVVRNRRLCGLALGYEPGDVLDYGLHMGSARAAWLPEGRFVVFLHATSHPSKLWPEDRWIALGRAYAAADCRAVLPWGSPAERERSQRLAAALPGAIVPERMELDRVAGMLAAATAVVGVDTGLTHLAAALDRPVVGIYGVTSPGTTGVYAHGRAVNVGSRKGFPSVEAVLAALAGLDVAPGQLAAEERG
jgi:heptosyltransferase-1